MAQARYKHSPGDVDYSNLSDETLRKQIPELRNEINLDDPDLRKLEELSMRLVALHKPTEEEKYSRGVIFENLSAGYFAEYKNTNKQDALENSFKYCKLALEAYAAVADSPSVGERAIDAANQFIIHSEERYQNSSLNEYVVRLRKVVAERNAALEQKRVAAEEQVIKKRAIEEKKRKDEESAAASRIVNPQDKKTDSKGEASAKMEEEWGSESNGEEGEGWDEQSKSEQEQQEKEDKAAAEKQKDGAWNFKYTRSPLRRINPAATGLNLSPIELPQNSASSTAFSATVMSLADPIRQGSSAASGSLSSDVHPENAAMHVESAAALSHSSAESANASVASASASQANASTGSNSSENAMDTGENSSGMTSTFAAASQQSGAAVAGSPFHLTPLPSPIGPLGPTPSPSKIMSPIKNAGQKKDKEDEDREHSLKGPKA